MGFFDFFKKPKWKNSSSSVRLSAVEEMTVDDQETLLEVIRKDSDQQVRLAALSKIDDQQALESLSQEKLVQEMIEPVRKKLDEMYAGLLMSGAEEVVPDELLAAISDKNIVARVAVEAKSVDTRCLAVTAIDDVQVLYDLLGQHIGKKPALAAVKKIDDPEMLKQLSEKAVNKSARAAAAGKLAELDTRTVGNMQSEPESASVEQVEPEDAVEDAQEDITALIADTIKIRQDLCLQLESLNAEMGENAAQRFAELGDRWPLLEPEFDSEELLVLQQRYDTGCVKFRAVLAEWETENECMAQLRIGCRELEKVLAKDNLDGAETLLAKLEATLKDASWKWLKPGEIAGRFATLKEQLEKKKEQLVRQKKTEQEHVQALQDLCVQMEELVDAPDRIQAEKQAGQLGKTWKKLAGRFGSGTDELTDRFQAASNSFREKQEQFYKEQEWEHWNNKTRKEELCAQAEALKTENDLFLVSTKVKECQAAWKEIGPVPRKYSDALWNRFKSACDENFTRCREFFAGLDQKREESRVIKEGLCIQAEEHVASTDWKKSADALKALQKEWKEAGPATREKEQALYKRFRGACDQFFDRRSAFFAEKDAERKENLLAKEQLCKDVEALVGEPKLEYGKKIQELQKKWKTIGPVPREHDQEIWQRFRGTCDAYYNWLDTQRQENLARKIALCEQVEALVPDIEIEEKQDDAAQKVVEVQKQWKTIGPVPRKNADEIWERFRGVCDKFFVARKVQQQEAENKRLENQSRKQDLLRKAGEVIQQDDERAVTEQLKLLQQEWKEVGAAPREQEQILWEEFQGLCNAFFQQKKDRYEQKKSVLDDNLKKKEELCFQLERLVGNEPDMDDTQHKGSLDLIEQFKIARESNFLLAGKTDNKQAKKEEVLRIQKEWKNIGATHRSHEQRLWKRYRKAMDLFFSS